MTCTRAAAAPASEFCAGRLPGPLSFFEEKAAKLGPDPLRDDADPARLWAKVQGSSKSIGAILMDQSCVA